jgi:hypothetical protein
MERFRAAMVGGFADDAPVRGVKEMGIGRHGKSM